MPIGRYSCCGDRAYRFQLLDNQAGCKFREHTPCVSEVRDAAVVNMLEMYRHLIEEEPPELMFPERLTRLIARGKKFFSFQVTIVKYCLFRSSG